MSRGMRRVLVILLAFIPGALRAADDVDPRGDVETMEALLDRVVRRVSQPSAAPFFGATEASRAYRLQGYGVVFVVPPRALPPSDRMGMDLGPSGRVAIARGSAGPSGRAQESATAPPTAGPRGAKAHAARERELKAIEDKVDALSREAERQRAEAERILADAMQRVQLRMMAPDAPPAPATPAAPLSPIQALPPGPAAWPDPPPTPPWRFWNEDSDDPRSPDDVVRDVKAAVSEAIEAAGGRLRSVRPEEFVVVAIDFVPQWDFGDGARADRTLVVRVRKKDLVDHESGKLGSEDLRKRIEYVQY